MAIKMCPKCGGKVSESRDNCPHCGYIFKPTKKCPDCEEQVDFDVKECQACGHIFEKEIKEDNVAPMVAPLPVADKVNADVNNNKVEKATKDNVQTNIVGIRCPHCGSNEIIQLNKDNYQCQVCGSTFMVDKGPDTVVNGDIIINNGPVKYDVSKFDDGIIIDKTLSEKDFMLGVLKHLLEDTNTPRDIFSAKFDAIKQYQVNYILLKGHANVTYSRTLGFDRQEEYITQDNKRIEAGSWYTCKGVQKYASETKVYYVDVTKTKTVTDWRPDSGVVFGSSGGIVENSCGEKIGEKDEKEALIKASDSITDEQGHFLTSEELAKYVPEQDAIERAKKIIVRNIYTFNTSTAYDHVDDERYSGDVEIDLLSINVYPVYSVEFSLRDKKYNILSPAFGCPVPYYLGKQEFVDVQSDGAVKKALEEKFKKRVKRNIALIIATIILCAILIILTPAVIEKAAGGTVAGIIETITYIFGFGSIAALIIGVFVAKKRHEKKLRVLESQIMSAKQDDYNKIVDMFQKTGKLVSVESKEFDKAIELFASISSFKDSDEQIKICEEEKTEQIYQSCTFDKAIETNCELNEVEKLIEKLKSIIEYKDSGDLVIKYQSLVDDFRKQQEEKRKQALAKKKAKIKKIAILSSISSFVIVVAMLLTFLLFVPTSRQNKIINAINNKDYETAEVLLDKNGSFGKSSKLNAMVNAGNSFEKGNYEEGIDYLYNADIPTNVSYDTDGGTATKTSETIKKSKYINNIPTKNGYNFDKWTLKDYSLSAKSLKANAELFATYNLATYNITYNLDGGTNDSRNPKTYTTEDTKILYPPTKVGSSFTGWVLNGAYINSISKGTYGNITLTAVWKTNDYSVVVTSQDTSKGTASGGGSYTYGSQVTVTATPNNGYSFEGWYKSSNKVSSSSSYTFILGASDVSLEARWTPIVYSISYSLDGGTNNSSNPTTYTIEDSKALLNPTKTGYSFIGWTLNGGKIESITAGMYGDITLTATWSINSYNITVTSQDTSKGTVTGSGSYPYGSQVSVTATPNNGYAFDGWYQLSSKVSSSASYTFTLGASDVSLEARWSLITYSITYNLDGGTQNSDNPTTYTIEDTKALYNPTKIGHTFTGWKLNDSIVSSVPKGTYGDITLTATWSINSYNITVTSQDTSKGTVTGSGSYPYGSQVTVTASPNNDYAFKGWYHEDTKVSDNATYTFNMPANDYSLEASFFTKAEEEEELRQLGVIPTLSSDGKTITYGLYPQKNVNDSSLVSNLNKLTKTESNGWYLYNDEYYAKVSATPFNYNYKFDNGTTIKEGTTYWFKCEPIIWNILSNNNDEYYILSNVLLDAHCYCNSTSNRTINGKTIDRNNYEHSDIRLWLNNKFYNSAFALGYSNILTTTVDNSPETTDSSSNPYACENTQDKVFLPSYQDYINSSYGFSTSTGSTNIRYCKTTDYARARGAYYDTSSSYLYNGLYWTRSPNSVISSRAWLVHSDGSLDRDYDDFVSYAGRSVRPALTIKIA